MKCFLLLGKRYSWTQFVFEFCKHNPAIRCVTEIDRNEGELFVLKVTAKRATELIEEYGISVFPVFIDTPPDIILQDGIEACKRGAEPYEDMAKHFIEDCSIYTEQFFVSINAHRISATNPADAAVDFVNYMKSVSYGG